jgi:phosphoglycerol transferase MdoB-like AlkP superfamily enzyme
MNDYGYTTRFFTASSTEWCHIGQFVRKIGFDESLGGNMMDEEFFLHDWGVPDRLYFNYLSEYEYGEKSFNVILTVSNHPPYDVDIKGEGCPNEITDPLENKVQHHWYADKSLGDFVEKMRARYPDALFIITGDHPARLNPPYLGEEFENRMCVPLMFAGRPIENANLVSDLKYASHMDIMPTLVELIADKDYEYKSWGESLLTPARRYEPLNPYSIFYNAKLWNPKTTTCPPEAREKQRAYLALAYWRSVKGSDFPSIIKKDN